MEHFRLVLKQIILDGFHSLNAKLFSKSRKPQHGSVGRLFIKMICRWVIIGNPPDLFLAETVFIDGQLIDQLESIGCPYQRDGKDAQQLFWTREVVKKRRLEFIQGVIAFRNPHEILFVCIKRQQITLDDGIRVAIIFYFRVNPKVVIRWFVLRVTHLPIIHELCIFILLPEIINLMENR